MTNIADRTGSDKTANRPFRVETSEAELTELRRRISATRWPERETVSDATQGVQLATIQALAHYWATEYDWRKVEARLQSLPNFITEIDGLDIHFIHVRSKHENALPLIVTHGWPGSVIPQRTAGAHRTPSIWSFRRCRATASPADRPRLAGVRYASRAPGTC